MKKWEAKYEENVILVENYVNGERLYVNGDLQDEQMGIVERSRLWGQLPTGETVKVSLGGRKLKVECRIFIDNKLILSE